MESFICIKFTFIFLDNIYYLIFLIALGYKLYFYAVSYFLYYGNQSCYKF